MFEISFVHPYWLFLLEIIPLMILFYFRNYRRQRSVIQLSSLKHLNITHPTWRTRLIHLPFILRLISVMLILIALAEPVKDRLTHSLDKIKPGIVYILDISRSMLDRDFLPNRMEAVKSSLAHFVNHEGLKSGIILMDSGANILLPLSEDISNLQSSILNIQSDPSISTPDLTQAIQLSYQLLDSIKAGNKFVLCIGSGQESNKTDPASLIEQVKSKGIMISSITVAREGTVSSIQNRKGKLVYRDSVSDIEEGSLLALCRQSGGDYTRATNVDELDRALSRISNEMLKSKSRLHYSKDGIFPFTWLAGILLILEIGLRNSIFKSLP